MEKIKIPTCKYYGKTDPTVHLSAFGGHMMLYTNTDSMWCKVFPSTLDGMAQSWFNKIPKGSVTSFRQLAILFRTHYVANIVRERMMGELMSFVQGSRESLRDYISRFNMEASNIPKLQQEVAVLAMMSGLKDGDFKSYLGRKSFTTLAEVLGEANEFIKSEEIEKATAQRNVAEEGNQAISKRRNHIRSMETEEKATKAGESGEDKIFAISKEDERWQRPAKMYNKYRDPKKYCDFHGDHGHLTEECTNLKDNIEDLIRRGYLTQFKAKSSYSRTYENRDSGGKNDEKRMNIRQNQQAYEKRSCDIFVVTGGPVHTGTTASGAKASVNEISTSGQLSQLRQMARSPTNAIVHLHCRGLQRHSVSTR
nr:uncharacterized protein LOC110782540 [Spinacia oleracea]